MTDQDLIDILEILARMAIFPTITDQETRLQALDQTLVMISSMQKAIINRIATSQGEP